MIVICQIMVIAFHFYSPATVSGKVIGKNSNNYLVDFSKDAKKQGFEGDYSEVFVSREKCVKK